MGEPMALDLQPIILYHLSCVIELVSGQVHNILFVDKARLNVTNTFFGKVFNLPKKSSVTSSANALNFAIFVYSIPRLRSIVSGFMSSVYFTS